MNNKTLEAIKKRTQSPNLHSNCGTYFSVSFDLVKFNCNLPYDLFVNSSIVEHREKFVKIFKAGDYISRKDLFEFKRKYFQLYILEKERQMYLSSICTLSGDKVAILKEAAINHLEKIFSNKENYITPELLSENIQGCKNTINELIKIINTQNLDSLQDLIGNLSFHDFYTYDHSVNVSMYTVLLFKAMYPDCTHEEVITAGMGGLLHDLGKVKISTKILNGTTLKLSEEAYNEIKKHPQYGYDLIKDVNLDCNKEVNSYVVGRIILEHHENFNGTGYPNKMAGNKIHKMARICAVADFFDAITTKRSYQDPLSISEALALMSKHVGTKLDPEVFAAFVSLTQNRIKNNQTELELNENFDPCKPNGPDCFCKGELGPKNFGDIILLGKSLEEFKSWLKENKDNVRFLKTD